MEKRIEGNSQISEFRNALVIVKFDAMWSNINVEVQ